MFTVWSGFWHNSLSLFHVMSAGVAQYRGSTSKIAHSRGWLLALACCRQLGWSRAWWGLGRRLGLEFLPCGPLQVAAWDFSLHESRVPRGRKRKLPAIFNAWAQNSQNVISSALYSSKQKWAQLRFTGRAHKLQLLMARAACMHKKVKFGGGACLKISFHHSPCGHNNTCPLHVKNTCISSPKI